MKKYFIKDLLERVIAGRDLNRDESFNIFNMILSGELTNAQIASLLTSLKIKGETVDEIAGAALAMKENAVKIPLGNKIQSEPVDTCGTGGDSKDTFNISTCAALIAAGAGVKIAKHGNYAVSSKSGSADVLKELGVNIFLDAEGVLRSIEYANIGFLFAPEFHTAMKYAASVRKELGFKTIFNILGPLTNPLCVKKQVMGVYSRSLSEKIIEVLKIFNIGRAFVVHSRDGMDEVGLSGITDIYELDAGSIKYFEFNPKKYGFNFFTPDEFKSLSVDSSAKIIYDILKGNAGPKSDIAILNAGFAILVSGTVNDLQDAFSAARRSVESGDALNALKNLVEISNK